VAGLSSLAPPRIVAARPLRRLPNFSRCWTFRRSVSLSERKGAGGGGSGRGAAAWGITGAGAGLDTMSHLVVD
jgi:hypothetical protein